MTVPRRILGVILVGSLVVAGACSSSGGTEVDRAGRPEASTTTSAPVRGSAGCNGRASRNAGVMPVARTVTVGGRARRYLLATPAPSARPAPMVVLLHGFAGNAEGFAALTRMPAKAVAAGFVVVVPDAGAPSWGLGASADEAFVEAAIAEVSAERCIDRDRVAVAGFSLGAAFAITYTCRHPKQVAALATVAVDFQLGCTQPVPYLAFHGDADPLVRYQDGAEGASLPDVKVRGTENNLADWAKLDRCRLDPATKRVSAHVVRQTWSRCAPGTDVRLFTIEGGSHAWPGGDQTRSVAPVTQEVDATAELLRFFIAHPLTIG